MKKVAYAAAAVLVLGAGAVLAAPALIDWNQWRGEVAGVLELATGRQVAIGGELDLALLPRPVLSARDVTLRALGQSPDDAPLAVIGAVDLTVRPLALLRGAVQVETLSLLAPDLRVELLPDGSRLLPVEPAALGGAVRIDRVELREGVLTLRDRRGAEVRDLVATALSGTADAGGPDGPYHFDGAMTVAGQRLVLEITSGRVGPSDTLPLRANLTLPDGSTTRFSGVLEQSGPFRLQGEVRADGRRLAPALAAGRALLGAGAPAPADNPALDQPFSLRARLVADAAQLSLDGIEAALGDTRAVGSGELPLDPTARGGGFVLSFTQLDLDAWTGGNLPALPRTGRYSLDLLADSVKLAGASLRDGALVGVVEDGVLTLDRATATFPGGLAVGAQGTVTTGPDGRLRHDLTLTAEAQNLRESLTWAGLDVTGVPVERLRQGRAAARFQGTADRFTLSDLAAELDGTVGLTGALSYDGTGRPGFGIRLEADRLDLDAYLPAGAVTRARLEQWVAGTDLALQARIGQLTAAGLPVEGLELSGTLQQGALDLRQLTARSAAGVSVRLGGQAAGLFPLRGVALTLSAEAETLAPLFRALRREPPVPTDRLGAVSVTGRAVGDAQQLGLELTAGFLSGTLQLGGAIRRPESAPDLDLKLRATFPELVEVARLALPGWQPGRPRLGAVDLYAELSGPPAAPTAGALQGRAGPVTVKAGTLALDRRDGRPALTARLDTGPLDPVLLLPVLGQADSGIDLSWTHDLSLALELVAEGLSLPETMLDGLTLEDAALSLATAPGEVSLSRLEGGWRGGRLAAEGRISHPAGEGVPATAALALRIEDAAWPGPLPEKGSPALTGGRFDLQLLAEGGGTDLAALTASLTGKGQLGLRGATLDGLDMARLSAELPQVRGREAAQALLTAALGRGSTPLAPLEGPLVMEGGRLAAPRLTASTGEGRVTLAGGIDRKAGRIEAELTLDPAPTRGVPELAITLSGRLSAPERQVRADELLAWAAARGAIVTPPPLVLQGQSDDGQTGPTAAPPTAPPGRPPAAPPATPPPTPPAEQAARPAERAQPADRDAFIKGILEKLKPDSGS